MKFRREHVFLPMACLPNVSIASDILYGTKGNRKQQTVLERAARRGYALDYRKEKLCS
jgi:hypothetical protein